jgi:hypothetical protein
MLRHTLCALPLLACSGGSGNTVTPTEVARALDTSFGGYDTKSEQPNFGDDAVLAVPRFDAAFASHASPDGSSSVLASYRVALLWGHFPGANDDSDGDADAKPASWSGTVTVDAGGIDVLETLSFDAGDSIDARTDAKTVSFTSHTLPFVDGLFLRVQIPIDHTARLHFATSELTSDVDLDAIAHAAGSVVHVDGDQGLVAVGWTDTGATCPSGIAYGRFVKLGAAVGTLRGHVMAADGADLGFVHGIWGHAQQRDADVFFGKTIDPSGAFGRLTLGTYKEGEIHGTMGNDKTQGGSFVGLYSDGYDRADGRGVFVAKWSSVCTAM